MNKDQLNARLKELENSIKKTTEALQSFNSAVQQHNANLNVLIGQRAEIQHWLQEMDKVQLTLVEPEKVVNEF